MIGVAVVLILLVLIFGTAVVVSNSGQPTVGADGFLEFSIFGARIAATLPGIFFTGAATMIILILAVLLLALGLRRARGQRQRVKSLKKSAAAVESSETQLKPGQDDRAAVGTGDSVESQDSKDSGRAAKDSGPETTPEDRDRLLDEVEEATGPDDRPSK